MLACKLSAKIFIIMRKKVEVYSYIEEGKHSNKFSKEKEFLIPIETNGIIAGILSVNEKYLALLLSSNNEKNAKI